MNGDRSIILSGSLLVPSGPSSVHLTPGTVVVEGERITQVRVGAVSPSPSQGGEDSLILPGFVDTHLHLPQFDSIGIDGLELLDWLESAVFPAEMRWADPDFARDMTRRVADELYSFGTTGIAAYATSHAESAQAAIGVLGEVGMAGYVGMVLMDQNAPGGLLVPASAGLSQASSLRGHGRISPAVTPRFAVSCSRQLLEGAGVLAARTNWLVQTHLAETRRECELVRRLHGAVTYTDLYRECGLLTPRTILGHGIWLDDEQRAKIGTAGSAIAHCPTANRFLDAGVMKRYEAIRAGVSVPLGTDIGAGPDRSMVRVARAAMDAAKQAGGPVPDAAELWHQITAGNARAIGLRDTGVLEQGAFADLLVIRPSVRWAESRDPLGMLLYAWDDRWLRSTYSAGRVVYRAN